ncbi:capsular exopolysaccharide synthesis family protein [Polymorphobacter multimanifer]|uniref:Capsular exopolysaccharide synthesis family protein n=1 Tax=Polymorphobacter multimanifer TaxID=1070431 RepID=A0A841LA12_9SPHN|nr:CpsD/CapB family tyrosine-protein kinase [Polymorphobacter multimanifer]MBB6225868.1 capsular exopolysaccharide synthesis family protein [Polymorphobacter multimanifer]
MTDDQKRGAEAVPQSSPDTAAGTGPEQVDRAAAASTVEGAAAEPRGPVWLPPEQHDAIAATLGGRGPTVADAALDDVETSAAEDGKATAAGAAASDGSSATGAGAGDGSGSSRSEMVRGGGAGADTGGAFINDGSQGQDDPIRDTLLQLGYLSEDQSARVTAHAVARGLAFDQAALELGFITFEDLDRAREQLINSLAQTTARRRPVSDELVVISDPRGLRAEAVRLLRTQVIAQHIKAGRRGLALVSPVVDSGCSNLVSNLAVALSQVGIKTLLVDANLRAPRLHEIFGLDADAPGLTSYLSMQVSRPERVVQANVLPSLAIITAGPTASRPQELLSSRRFRDGVNMLLREYDLVLFDTPPANSSADALTIGAAAGYVMLVARRDQAYFKDISTLVEQLQTSRCPLIGSVLNEF